MSLTSNQWQTSKVHDDSTAMVEEYRSGAISVTLCKSASVKKLSRMSARGGEVVLYPLGKWPIRPRKNTDEVRATAS